MNDFDFEAVVAEVVGLKERLGQAEGKLVTLEALVTQTRVLMATMPGILIEVAGKDPEFAGMIKEAMDAASLVIAGVVLLHRALAAEHMMQVWPRATPQWADANSRWRDAMTRLETVSASINKLAEQYAPGGAR